MNLPDDPFLWLEEIEDERALMWVQQKNSASLAYFQADSRYQEFEQAALRIYEAKDKIPYGALRGGYVYNFLRDDVHIRGIWRRTLLSEYQKKKPDWDTLLDIDQLAQAEGENWVYQGVNCLHPDYTRCIVSLSRGGKDAVVMREYDLTTRAFVTDGFYLPEAKSGLAWIDENQVLVATDFGPGSLTESGYPAIVKRWQRGQPLDQAQLILEIDRSMLSVRGYTQFRPEGNYTFLVKSIDFWTTDILWLAENGEMRRVNLPPDADFQRFWKGQALTILRSDWRTAKQGAVIALDLTTDEMRVIHQPGPRESVSFVATLPDALLITTLENVTNVIYEAHLNNGQWRKTILPFEVNSVIEIVSANDFHAEYLVSVRNFLQPDTIYLSDGERQLLVPLKRLPPRFDASNLEVTQYWATSHDGTPVPYFVVASKDLKNDGQNPTLLYGYGGFEHPMLPDYHAIEGKLWLERGGVYVLANIRGGGEFGPQWHQAALQKNRHKAFEDFISIAEDLIRNKITKASKLAIMGGSNGGLLMGAMLTQRPELFKAIICRVPLLDMLRYHQLLAGASWMAEYGDPDDPEMRDYLAAYSPYHQVAPERQYPAVFFITSTKDDRVHPGHARKMVAKMEAQGHPVYYYENTEGGHSAGANLKQYANMDALEYVYLHKLLMDE